MIFFAADMMCRIVPAIEDLKYITPFYYSNASDIFTNGVVEGSLFVIGAVIVVLSFVVALFWYQKKDLAS